MSDSEKEQNEGEEAAKSPEESSSASEESTPDADETKSTKNNDDDERDEGRDEESDADDGDADEGDADEDDESEQAAKSSRDDEPSSSSPLLIAVLALAAGFGVGWFGHNYQVEKALKTADAAVQGEGDGARGPCKDWETAFCTKFGDKSFPCVQAQSVSSLLSGSACEQAIKTMDAQVKKIEDSRASCTNMMDKLCGDLGAESKACELVRDQTPSFAPQRCEDMMKNYDQVLGQLKMMEQRGALPGQGGPGGPGGPGGHPPSVRVSPTTAPSGPAPSGGPVPSGPAPAPAQGK